MYKNLEVLESTPKSPRVFQEKTPKKGPNLKNRNSVLRDNEIANAAAFDYLKSQVLKYAYKNKI